MNPLILVAAAAAAAVAYAISRPKKTGGRFGHVIDRIPPEMAEAITLAFLSYKRCRLDLREMADSPEFETNPQRAIENIRTLVVSSCPEVMSIPLQERITYGKEIFANSAILIGYGFLINELCQVDLSTLQSLDDDYFENAAQGTLESALQAAEASVAQVCPAAAAMGRTAAQQKGFEIMLQVMP